MCPVLPGRCARAVLHSVSSAMSMPARRTGLRRIPERAADWRQWSCPLRKARPVRPAILSDIEGHVGQSRHATTSRIREANRWNLSGEPLWQQADRSDAGDPHRFACPRAASRRGNRVRKLSSDLSDLRHRHKRRDRDEISNGQQRRRDPALASGTRQCPQSRKAAQPVASSNFSSVGKIIEQCERVC